MFKIFLFLMFFIKRIIYINLNIKIIFHYQKKLKELLIKKVEDKIFYLLYFNNNNNLY